MTDDSEIEPINYERIPLLEEGKITSKVPPSLLSKATDAEKEWYATMSVMEQRMDLARLHLQAQNRHIRMGEERMDRLERRMAAVESVKRHLTSWWGGTLVLAGVVAGCYQAYQWLRKFFNP